MTRESPDRPLSSSLSVPPSVVSSFSQSSFVSFVPHTHVLLRKLLRCLQYNHLLTTENISSPSSTGTIQAGQAPRMILPTSQHPVHLLPMSLPSEQVRPRCSFRTAQVQAALRGMPAHSMRVTRRRRSHSTTLPWSWMSQILPSKSPPEQAPAPSVQAKIVILPPRRLRCRALPAFHVCPITRRDQLLLQDHHLLADPARFH